MYCPKCGAEAGDTQSFCIACGGAIHRAAPVPGSEPETASSPAMAKLQELRARLAEVEVRVPKTNVLSPKFWTRAFAVLGHNLSAVLVIYAGVIVIAMVIGFVAALAFRSR